VEFAAYILKNITF